MLMIKTMNMASIGLIVYMEAVDEGEDKATGRTEAEEGVYTKEINDIEETREQDSCKRNAMFAIN